MLIVEILQHSYFYGKLKTVYYDAIMASMDRIFIPLEENHNLYLLNKREVIKTLTKDIYDNLYDWKGQEWNEFKRRGYYCLEYASFVEQNEKGFNHMEKARKEPNKNRYFKLLVQTRSVSFVVQEITEIFRKNLFNQKLWIKLINFLIARKSNDYLLEIYTIYCRVFPQDFVMLQRYKTLAQQYKKIYVFWKKLYNFETAATPRIWNKAGKRSWISVVRRDKKVKPVEPKNGKISLPTLLFWYILKTSKYTIRMKLFKSSKYIYKKFPTPICHRLILKNHETEYLSNSMKIFPGAEKIPKKLFLVTSLHVIDDGFKKALSTFLPNIYQCEVKYVRIYGQKLTRKEFEFIANFGGIKILTLKNTKIFEDGKTLMALEDIIKMCPKILKFHSNPTQITSLTSKFLDTFEFKNKLLKFKIRECTAVLDDPKHFLSFFIKNSVNPDNEDEFDFTFSKTVDEKKVEEFNETLNSLARAVLKN